MEGSECTIKWQTEKEPRSHSITDVFLTAFHSIPSSDSASEALLYPESDHEATDPKKSLRSAAQQSDPARSFLLISSAVQRNGHVVKKPPEGQENTKRGNSDTKSKFKVHVE